MLNWNWLTPLEQVYIGQLMEAKRGMISMENWDSFLWIFHKNRLVTKWLDRGIGKKL